MRWKVLQFLAKLGENNKETYRFKSRICKQSVDQLNKFEEDLVIMIKNIDFGSVHKKFQEKLKHNITEIRNSNKVIVPQIKPGTYVKWKKKVIINFYPRILHIRNRTGAR